MESKIILSQRYINVDTGKRKTLLDVSGEKVLIEGNTAKWVELKDFIKKYRLSSCHFKDRTSLSFDVYEQQRTKG